MTGWPGTGKTHTLRALLALAWAKGLRCTLAAPTGSDTKGRRPVYGGTAKFQNDPHWRDLILFYEG